MRKCMYKLQDSLLKIHSIVNEYNCFICLWSRENEAGATAEVSGQDQEVATLAMKPTRKVVKPRYLLRRGSKLSTKIL